MSSSSKKNDKGVHCFLKEFKTKKKKHNRSKKKRKREDKVDDDDEEGRRRKKDELTSSKLSGTSVSNEDTNNSEKKQKKSKKEKEEEKRIRWKQQQHTTPLPLKYICAPMVGASELAFRLFCRRYGADIAYTPMMSAHEFVHSDEYRKREFQTCLEDRPLVCHFSANDPKDFAQAARMCYERGYGQAIDLNLGCPQRTAYVGHFGSYLLGCGKDRNLICDMIRQAIQAVDSKMPIFVKIRLLDTIEETILLCKQLRDAGASLVAVHARYRATWDRKGPGARDGPAMLEQVTAIKQAIPDIAIIANGNVITYEDVVDNLKTTQANGIMSAEGLLDNPSLFLPRYNTNGGSDEEQREKVMVTVPKIPASPTISTISDRHEKKKRKLTKKIQSIDDDDAEKKKKALKKLAKLEKKIVEESSSAATTSSSPANNTATTSRTATTDPCIYENCFTETIPLSKLYETANDKLALSREYLSFVKQYPIVMRTIVFHVRRMLKDELNKYQLMQDCLACPNVDTLESILSKIECYRNNPDQFVYDRQKAEEHRLAMEKQKQQEGKRRQYEERMIRKAKREGKKDKMYYLKIGAKVPTYNTLEKLRHMPRDKALGEWKCHHSQHCFSYHMEPDKCKRGRSCAFLHVDLHRFNERDEVAG